MMALSVLLIGAAYLVALAVIFYGWAVGWFDQRITVAEVISPNQVRLSNGGVLTVGGQHYLIEGDVVQISTPDPSPRPTLAEVVPSGLSVTGTFTAHFEDAELFEKMVRRQAELDAERIAFLERMTGLPFRVADIEDFRHG